MDLRTSADIYSASRLVYDQNAWLRGKPFGHDNLLLISAGKVAHDFPNIRCLNSQPRDVIFCKCLLRLEIQKWSAGKLFQPSDGDILTDIHCRNQTLPAAILRHISNS